MDVFVKSTHFCLILFLVSSLGTSAGKAGDHRTLSRLKEEYFRLLTEKDRLTLSFTDKREFAKTESACRQAWLAKDSTRAALLLKSLKEIVQRASRVHQSVGFRGIQRGTLYFTGSNGDSLIINCTPMLPRVESLAVYRPDGRVDTRFDPRPRNNPESFRLSGGDGVYRITFHENCLCFVAVPQAKKAVFEPVREFPSMQCSRADSVSLLFRTDGGSFRLSGTTQTSHSTSEGVIALSRQGDTTDQRMHFEGRITKELIRTLGIRSDDKHLVRGYSVLSKSLPIAVDSAGIWRLRAFSPDERRSPLGFWLSGTPNFFSLDTAQWFVPWFDTANVDVTVYFDSLPYSKPFIGSCWDWWPNAREGMKAYGFLGLDTDYIHILQKFCEPYNDNGDPRKLSKGGFRMSENVQKRFRTSRDFSQVRRTIIPVIGNAPWLLELRKSNPDSAALEFAEFFEEAVRYVNRELNMPIDRQYWQIELEPNLDMESDIYTKQFQAAVRRIRNSSDSRIRAVKIGGPALGNPYDDGDIVDWEWIDTFASSCGAMADLVIWNQYSIYDIEQTYRFGQAIHKTHSIMEKHGKNKDAKEMIIGATNMRGGVYLQRERQDGFYSSLWWISSLSHICNTGKVSLVNYFFLHDAGARAKGFYTENWKPKPVAFAMAFFSRYCRKSIAVSVSNHSSLQVLASRDTDGDSLYVVVANTSHNPIATQSFSIISKGEWSAAASGEVLDEHDSRKPRPLSVYATGDDGAIFLSCVFPPRSISGIIVYPVASKKGK